MTCLICKINEADKTGSHIVPHFLIESLVNDGARGRDKEQSFQIGSDVDFYFGRSVLPEHLEENFGHEVTDEEIANNQHHYVKDYVFCAECENKLAVLESLYSSKIKNALVSRTMIDPSQSKVAYFFWLSVILRCSVTRFNDFKLDLNLEGEVRKALNNVLSYSYEVFESNCIKQNCEWKMVIALSASSTDDSRNHVLAHPLKNFPYLLIVNNYLLVFCVQGLEQLKDVSSEIGIELDWKAEECPVVQYLSPAEREAIISFCLPIAVESYLQELEQYFRNKFFKKNQIYPRTDVLDSFKREFLNEDVALAEKYRESRKRTIAQKYI